MVVRLPVALALGLLLAFVPPTLANHPQAAHGDVIVFDHKTGNEWWVEVVLSGGASGSVSGVQAMDTGGAWVALSKQSWGAWAASFHIEPGHLVKFRATWSGGEQVESCWFTHPAGVEQCGGSSSSSSTTTTGGAFDATFSSVKGNEWWVEAKVAANQPLAGVDARVNCGTAWRPLGLRDWGSWAASFNIPAGSKVDFRARSASGATDLSGGYVWTAATPTSGCGGSSTTTTTPPPPPPGFRATFSGVSGNAWWVQAKVAANEPLAGVDARYGCGYWRPLRLESWGSWTASFHIPDGSTVDFRARSTDGDSARSGGYAWPSATPTAGCPDPPTAPPAWDTTTVHDGFPAAGVHDLAFGTFQDWSPDPALYIATHAGLYWAREWNGAVGSEFLDDLNSWSIALGDADRDGDNDLYAGSSDGQVYLAKESGPGGIQPYAIATLGEPGTFVQTLTVGDADRDGLSELYAVGQDGGVHRIWDADADGLYESERIADIGVMGLSSWIADGDRDGDRELYLGGHGGGVYKVERTATGWSTVRMMQLCCDFAVQVTGVAAGDGNGDGKAEVYAAVADGLLRKLTWTGSAWTVETIATFEAPLGDLTLADADPAVPGQELYVAAGEGVWQVRWTGTGWAKTLLGASGQPYDLDTLVVGDIDRDGVREVLAGGNDGDVYQVEP